MEITILYFIRAEADLERITSIALAGKEYAIQKFFFWGDSDLVFKDGIKNEFQKHLLATNNFEVTDVISISLFGKTFKQLRKSSTSNRVFKTLVSLVQKVLSRVLFRQQEKLARRLLNSINPDVLITDNSEERENYFPHVLRQEARKQDITIHVTGHGPAGGLHKEYHSYEMLKPDPFDGCTVGICSKHDYGNNLSNRIITGDPADSFPHLLHKHSLSYGDIYFLNERTHKIGFFMAAPFETCTNGWSVMEEIMLNYAGQGDVAMIAKFHPRLYKHGDYRYLNKIDNLKLYGSELDRSKLVKWADIVVCSDHCSTIFEPMIFQKKVVAVHSVKVHKFAKYESPIHNSDPSMNSIHNSSEFKLKGLVNYTSNDRFVNEYCWGGCGVIDLGEEIVKRLVTNHD